MVSLYDRNFIKKKNIVECCNLVMRFLMKDTQAETRSSKKYSKVQTIWKQNEDKFKSEAEVNDATIT